MKTLLFLLALTFLSFTSNAQQFKPEYGSVSKAELESRKSTLDEKAEAEVVFDIANIELIFYDGLLEV